VGRRTPPKRDAFYHRVNAGAMSKKFP